MKFIAFAKYVGILIVATFLTFFFHEMSHWIAYELLGYDAGFTLNGASTKEGSASLTEMQRMITSAAGPLFTVIQGVLFYFVLLKHNNKLLYPFLFLPFIMRLGAGWANKFEPNDEGRISLALDLPLYTISAVVILFLFFLVYKISRKNHYGIGFNLITFIISALLLLAVAYLDAVYKIRFV